MLGEGLEQVVNGAGAVGGGDDEGGFVAAGGLGAVVAEDEETGGVVGLVFDVGSEFGQVVVLGGGLAGNGGGLRLGSGEAGSFGVAGHGNAGGMGQVAVEPLVTLSQRLGVGIHFFRLLTTAGLLQ
ncbi:hypothetical protein EIKCOROL_01163 [Eikenella corrodens ATCC 23834]|uniref:Uncharacterized protein n=1 Tax=Eikenella corrodens ATCC 23834 TaxID=546274 RepID=C0DUX4_EIKCO|nr:hypothetical protein EIKCOROL_01163 [Eikenella corrodens ATCC 23834]